MLRQKKMPYLRNGKAYELQTWYTDGVGLQVTHITDCTVTSKVKGQGQGHQTDK